MPYDHKAGSCTSFQKSVDQSVSFTPSAELCNVSNRISHMESPLNYEFFKLLAF